MANNSVKYLIDLFHDEMNKDEDLAFLANYQYFNIGLAENYGDEPVCGLGVRAYPGGLDGWIESSAMKYGYYSSNHMDMNDPECQEFLLKSFNDLKQMLYFYACMDMLAGLLRDGKLPGVRYAVIDKLPTTTFHPTSLRDVYADFALQSLDEEHKPYAQLKIVLHHYTNTKLSNSLEVSCSVDFLPESCDLGEVNYMKDRDNWRIMPKTTELDKLSGLLSDIFGKYSRLS